MCYIKYCTQLSQNQTLLYKCSLKVGWNRLFLCVILPFFLSFWSISTNHLLTISNEQYNTLFYLFVFTWKPVPRTSMRTTTKPLNIKPVPLFKMSQPNTNIYHGYYFQCHLMFKTNFIEKQCNLIFISVACWNV